MGARPRLAPKRLSPTKAPAIDIVIKSPLWNAHRGIKALLRRTIAAAAAMASTDGELAVVLTDDSAIRALNRRWRGKDEPTNVLSFPASVCSISLQAGTRKTAPHLFGDIVIAYETTAREAQAQRKPLRDHLAHLAVHGFLHLLGYDHAGEEEAAAMEALEIAVLARLDVPDPYVARAAKR
jgi:probable rRNA maturation factor